MAIWAKLGVAGQLGLSGREAAPAPTIRQLLRLLPEKIREAKTQIHRSIEQFEQSVSETENVLPTNMCQNLNVISLPSSTRIKDAGIAIRHSREGILFYTAGSRNGLKGVDPGGHQTQKAKLSSRDQVGC